MALRLALTGASGRMGQAIARLATAAGDDCVFTAGRAALQETAGLSSLSGACADVLIDFSSPDGFLAALAAARAAKVPFVSGTTGLDAAHFAALDAAAAEIPVLWAPNTSLGVAVLARLVAAAAAALGEDFDLEIVEVHHRKKLDAPSGTAIRLAEAARTASPASGEIHGRSGKSATERPRGEIALHAVRGGDVIGDHHVHFLGDGERIELVHRASNRDLFAKGALRAARYLVGKPPARYAFEDVLAR